MSQIAFLGRISGMEKTVTRGDSDEPTPKTGQRASGQLACHARGTVWTPLVGVSLSFQ